MSRYFFLGSVLPPLRVGIEPAISFDELMTLYRDNLSASDWKKIEMVRAYVDLKNVEAFFKKKRFDPHGNLSEGEVEEALTHRERLPRLLFDHLEGAEATEEELRHFGKVYSEYLKERVEGCSGFLKRYFAFEWEWRILLVGYRAKRLGLDVAVELQHEDFHDPLVAQVLAQKDASFFEFPFEFLELGELLKGVVGETRKEYEMMARFRFDRMSDAAADHPFSLDYLLGYMVQLMIVEEEQSLDGKKGNESLSEMVKGQV